MEATSSPDRGATPRRVMIVDDDDLVRATLADLLSLSGYQVCGLARDGLEAARLVGTANPDVILMDIVMPMMDGAEALQIINATRPTCSLVLSAHCSASLLEKVTQAGAQGYLVKPCRPTDLVPAIETAFSQFERSRVAADAERVSCYFERATSEASAGGPLGPVLDRALVESCAVLGRLPYLLGARRGTRLQALSTRGVCGVAPGQVLGPTDGRLGVAFRRKGVCRAHLVGAPATQAAMLSTRASLGGSAEGCLCLFAPEGHTFTHREEYLLRAITRGLTDVLHRACDTRPHAWESWLNRRRRPAPAAHRRR